MAVPGRNSGYGQVTAKLADGLYHRRRGADLLGTEESSEVFCLVTSLLDIEEYPALDLACCYVYRVRVWDAVLKKQIERTAEGLEAAKQLLEDFTEAKRRPGRLTAEHRPGRLTAEHRPGRLTAERVRFADVAARYLVTYKTKRDGTRRPGHRWPRSDPA